MKFDKVSIDRIHRDMEKALQPVAQKHGITIIQGGGSYGDLEASLKFRLRAESESGETQEMLDFKQYAEVFGLPVTALGQTIEIAGGQYKIVGLTPRRRKYPVVIQNVRTGSRKVAEPDFVRRQLGIAPKGIKVVDITDQIAQDVLEVIITADGKESTVIKRQDFTKKEWDMLQSEASMNELFGKKRRVLHGGVCHKEGGGCGQNKMLLVRKRKVGPDCVDLGYRCIGCGREESDVAD